MDDIPQLIVLCAEIKIEKWFLLGLQLKLDEETMYDIRNDQAFPTEEGKRQRMFEKWLKEDKDATNRKLLQALRTKVIGENATAEKYETMLRAKDISAKGNIYIHLSLIMLDRKKMSNLKMSDRFMTGTKLMLNLSAHAALFFILSYSLIFYFY